jgi:hypothetical protein
VKVHDGVLCVFVRAITSGYEISQQHRLSEKAARTPTLLLLIQDNAADVVNVPPATGLPHSSSSWCHRSDADLPRVGHFGVVNRLPAGWNKITVCDESTETLLAALKEELREVLQNASVGLAAGRLL